MAWRSHRRIRALALVLSAPAVGAACSKQPPPMVFDTVSPAESTVPSTPVESLPSTTTAAPRSSAANASTTLGGASTSVAPTTVAAATAAATSTTAVAGTSTAEGPSAPTTTVVGTQWEPATGNLSALQNDCGVLSYLAAHPDGRTLVAAVPRNGFWSSPDAGATWTQLGTSDADGVLAITTSVVFDPARPTSLWATGIYAGGVVRSDDSAATFQRLGTVTHVDLVSVDLTDPERRTLLAGAHEARALYRSRDGGATWEDVSAGLPERSGMSTAPLVLGPETFIVGTFADTEAGVFRSTDGGATWTRVWSGAVVSRPLVVGEQIYFLLDGGVGVIRSVDQGVTWTRHSGGGVTGGRGGAAQGSRSIIALPDGRLASIGERTLVVSDDHGDSWRPIGPTLPFTPNEVIYSPVHQRFVVWQNQCTTAETTGSTPIKNDSVMTLSFATAATRSDVPTTQPTGLRSTRSD